VAARNLQMQKEARPGQLLPPASFFKALQSLNKSSMNPGIPPTPPGKPMDATDAGGLDLNPKLLREQYGENPTGAQIAAAAGRLARPFVISRLSN
jgi:hypothetical protein